MKRTIAILLLGCILLTALPACGENTAPTPEPGPEPSEGTPAPTVPAPTENPTPTADPTSTENQTPEPGYTLTVSAANLPQAEFAGREIEAAAEKSPLTANWTVSLESIDESLGYEAYKIEVSGQTITVTGGDAAGLMYGGLQVADELSFGGFESVKSSSAAPTVLNRGIKFNIPLDMRTPSYTDAGEAAQLNIENMWDIDFWHAELDELARNRFNAMSIWNLNPFPSMVKLADYPDIALDDVWKTTIPFDGSYNGTATNMVREEHWSNYEVVKTMTIDEKIDFWREVMAYAHDRGIKFYVFTWNIYLYGEQGKYGLTDDIDNAATRAYYRACAEAMVETYPDLDGIGITAGENMKWETGDEEKNENWLWETYGLGVNDALEKEPEREFTLIHRMHLTDFALSDSVWADFKGTLDYSDKYSFAHMHSTSTPHFADETLSLLPESRRLWLEVRWDDMYYARWGDYEFIRDYVSGMPDESKLRGFLFGPDGYIFGRDYTSLDPEESGRLHIEKCWYEYALLGRLAYDPTLSEDYFKSLMAAHYGVDSTKAELLFEAMNDAGKIVPLTARYFWINTDAYYPEMCLTNKTAFGFLTVKLWANAQNALEGGGMMSMPDYVDAVMAGEESFELITPPELIDMLRGYADSAMDKVSTLLASEPASYASINEREFWSAVKDQRLQAEMGYYYAEKTAAALDLRMYNATSDTKYQEAAIEKLNNALELWKTYAADFAGRYQPMLMGRLQLAPNPTELIKDAENDIKLAQRWRPGR